MTRRFFVDAVGWGLALWLFGYLLGFILFFVVPTSLIGWVITPVATLVTIWVAYRKVDVQGMGCDLGVGCVWLAIALAGDYFGIVKALNPVDGYYKLDVYLYYALTLAIPLIAGVVKRSNSR